MPWTRPADVPVGQVWLRFKGRERNGKPAQIYQIRDVEEKDKERCIDLMVKYFLRDEPLCRLLDICSDPDSLATVLNNWRGYLSQNTCLACYTEVDGEPDELVAYNNLVVVCRDDESQQDIDKVKGEPWKKLLKTLIVGEELVNIFDYFGVDKYMSDSGLTVSHEHRGQNIGARMLDAREPLCRRYGIKATAALFTATASQVLAQKCGYELMGVLPYERMKEFGVDLTGCETDYAELRGRRII